VSQSLTFNPVGARPSPNPPISPDLNILEAALNFYDAAFYTTSAAVPTSASIQFNIAQFGNNAEFLALFDQYRIKQIEVWLTPTGAQNLPSGVVATAIDLDDAAAPVLATTLSKPGAIAGNTSLGRYHRWQPAVADALYSGTFVGFGSTMSPWINSTSSTVQHYGFKIAGSTTTSVVAYDLAVRAICEFRNPSV